MKNAEIPNPLYTKRKENRAPNFPSEFSVCILEFVSTEIQELFLITEKSSSQVKKKEAKEIKK